MGDADSTLRDQISVFSSSGRDKERNMIGIFFLWLHDSQSPGLVTMTSDSSISCNITGKSQDFFGFALDGSGILFLQLAFQFLVVAAYHKIGKGGYSEQVFPDIF